MYGKHFASMYEGSMIGKGACFFAVWGYVISHMVPDKTVGTQVELNPKLIGFVLGEPEEVVSNAITEMCDPDPQSRTPDQEGRKLVKVGEYAYQVVNGAKYRLIRDEETRREQNREAKRRQRARKSKPMPGEAAYVRALNRGDSDTADAIAAREA